MYHIDNLSFTTMKNILKFTLMIAFLLSSNIGVNAQGTPTAYGVHTTVDASFSGIEWLFILASFVFVMGLVLVNNGRTLKKQIEI